MPSTVIYLEFEVSLERIRPRIWRRFLLRKNSTFHELHDTIQNACGWMDCHLYLFRPNDLNRYGENLAVSPYFEAEINEVAPPAWKIKLDTFFRKVGDQASYEYDFGDSWIHTVTLMAITRLPSQSRRKLVGGERAFPPEDCGGTSGYYQCLEAFRITDAELSKLDAETREELISTKEWFGDWNPERFDIEATNKAMKRRVNY